MISRRTFLNTSAAALSSSLLTAAPTKKPNIVFIFCDDLGYGDIGCYGSTLRTPHIDSLAKDGMRFTNLDSADPVCSPSRAALLTGRYPTRVGVPRVFFPQDTDGLSLDEKTLADVLKERGYRTACIGKWHLGRPDRYLPTNRGFDSYFGIPYSNDMNPRSLLEGTKVVEEPAQLETLTQRYTQHAVDFIRQSSGAPFFLYMPHTFPHIPLAASDRFRGKSKVGLYGDVIEELDWSVGEVLSELKRQGLDGNTLVMFSSDNGPWYQGSPGRLRGRKGTTYEGGVREPFIARWTGKIPAGRACEATASLMDVFPTIANLCGGTLPQKPLDGVDIWPLLTGRQPAVEREPLLYFDNWDLQCARWKQWKLHVARHNSEPYDAPPVGGRRNFVLPKPELYDLSRDPQESYDVAPENQDVVAEISSRIEKLLAGFPEPVQKAYADSKNRKVYPNMPTAGRPRAAAAQP
jgi:arylsulfatase A